MLKNAVQLPDWEQVLSSAARLQRILPDAVLVGGSAAAIHAGHRISIDADHVLSDLRHHFDKVLIKLEAQAGRKTARYSPPVIILGNFYGIETGVRQLIREAPLETMLLDCNGSLITVPTEAEILRIKAVLILRRNATRDYVDFAALGEHLGQEKVALAMGNFDKLYPQKSGESSLQQLLAQLSQALPFDLQKTNLKNYKNLATRYQDWETIHSVCSNLAQSIFENVCSPIVQEHFTCTPKP